MNAIQERDLSVLAVGVDPGDLTGCTVETADDLLGALAHLSDGGIDVVYVALDLPDAEGPDVVRGLLERAPDVPVVASGDVEPSEALRAGASDVLPADARTDLVSRTLRYASALQRVEARRHRLRTVDELTGLLNARGFELLANHHLRLADRTRTPVVLVFVRVDTPGDEPDDRMIQDAAHVVASAVRTSDIVARLGADAFCALLAGAAPGAEPLVLARIVEAVAAHNARMGHESPTSLSVGAATYDPAHPASLDEVIAEADRRLRGNGPAEPG